MRQFVVTTLFAVFALVQCIDVNFPFESVQLTNADVGNYSAINFGNKNAVPPVYDGPACKAYPGTPDWPLDDQWSRLNSSLGGALLKPVPIAAACYDGPYEDASRCNFLLRNARTSRVYINDPLAVLTEWPEGDTCYATSQTQGLDCTQGGFPVYVVNASTVKHIQIAVNFARNNNLRLVIKNSGHDFLGRSVGFGSLSVWTHWLKDFEFLPEYGIGEYDGMAARVSSGLESWEMFAHMSRHNMTLLVAGGYTVGAYGGWFTGGGHSALASKYGLGADQALSINVVTADGRFVTANMNQNADLFYALRGGGGSTYGIVTSLVVKAHPSIQVLASTLAFSVGGLNSSANDTETFWRGFDLYHAFGPTIVDNGGTAYSHVRRSGSSGFTFTTDIEVPGMSEQELFAFVQPLYNHLNSIGVRVSNPRPTQAPNWAATSQGLGGVPGSSRFASRLFPRANFEDKALFVATQQALRESVEAGYAFHGIHMQPTEEVAGYPGNNAVNPAFRTTVMHADLFDFESLRGLSPREFNEAHERLDEQMQKWRAVSPDSGAYFNEADVQEPNWQRAFFGSNYDRLLEIKRDTDPWGLFYAATTVGSEEWVVVTEDGLPTQNGPLCRTE
ncbi:hypothetical protein DL769_010187 [Monosporascus sp. CRB-8-3]|nr:hypothetical protein DL769_010187 [Monosporascus sp. CRB-8-3]